MATATSIAIAGILACIALALTGRRLTADLLTLPITLTLMVTYNSAAEYSMAVIVSVFGIAAAYRVLHALKAGALR